MIEQRPTNPDGSPGLWDTEQPGYVARDRAWSAMVMGPEMAVVVRWDPVLAVGEDWSGYPPTYELTWAEWVASHEVTYGLALDGEPITKRSKRKSDQRVIKRFANGTTPYDEQAVRDVVGAIWDLLKDLTPEVTD